MGNVFSENIISSTEAYIIYALIILKIVNTAKVLLYYFEWYFLLFFNEFSR